MFAQFCACKYNIYLIKKNSHQIYFYLKLAFQGTLDEWLHLLRLDEYTTPLLNQGYQSVRDVTQLTWEDLEDIGIIKLGHQKKILLAIKRVKDIISGKVVPCVANCPPQVMGMPQQSTPMYPQTQVIQQQ